MYCTIHKKFHRYAPCPLCAYATLQNRPEADPVRLLSRYLVLAAQPEQVQQDTFGVCGFSSMVYLLFKLKPAKALELFCATFAEQIFRQKLTFATAHHGAHTIDGSYIARRFELGFAHIPENYEKQMLKSITPQESLTLQRGGTITRGAYAFTWAQFQQAIQQGGQNVQTRAPSFLVDYCMSRGLGYLLKKTAPDRYRQVKEEFNREFDTTGSGSHKPVTRTGTLALTSNSVAWILQELLGARNLHIARNTGPGAFTAPAPSEGSPVPGVGTTNLMTPANIVTAFQTRYTARLQAGARPFAFAAVFADFLDVAHALPPAPTTPLNVPGIIPVTPSPNGTLPLPAVARNSHGADNNHLEYNHWVLLEGVGAGGAGTDFLIWTWGNRYQVTLTAPLSFIRHIVFGEF